MRRTLKGDALATFGNALRNYLGLEPIYQVGRNGTRSPKQASETERFYPGTFSLPSTSSRKARAA